MDGLLVVDKPAGPTSHDVVARARRALGERRIGHTGTLDPGATGVLPLVLGRATRLARFLSASDKTYEATLRLGFATDSGDSAGQPIGTSYEGPWPARDEIDAALEAFRGTFIQQPPALSAKRIGGERSHRLARAVSRQPASSAVASPPALPAAVPVTTRALSVLSARDECVTLEIACSAGFYVRSLAHDLGQRLGTGAHLTALRRTRSGYLTLDDAVRLAELEEQGTGRERAVAAIVPLARMLPQFPLVSLTHEGSKRAGHGRDLGPGDFVLDRSRVEPLRDASMWFRLVSAEGDLVALAEPGLAPGVLHPVVVLV